MDKVQIYKLQLLQAWREILKLVVSSNVLPVKGSRGVKVFWV